MSITKKKALYIVGWIIWVIITLMLTATTVSFVSSIYGRLVYVDTELVVFVGVVGLLWTNVICMAINLVKVRVYIQ